MKQLVVGIDTSNFPVEAVHWAKAVAFCELLTAMPDEQAAGRSYRLPTEAEWEFACRAGTTTRWHCGDDEGQLNQYAWVGETGSVPSHQIGQKLPNSFGLFDMHGNVNEWCLDWWAADKYRDALAVDPFGPPAGEKRVTRGGHYLGATIHSRSADRSYFPKYESYVYRGFRVVCVTPAMSAAKFITPPADGKGAKPAR